MEITPISAMLPAQQGEPPDPNPASGKPGAPERRAAAPDVPTYGFALRIDEQTREVIAVITDPKTRAVIREIPPEEMRTASNVIRRLIGRLADHLA